jgi:hypothetical protein
MVADKPNRFVGAGSRDAPHLPEPTKVGEREALRVSRR